MDRHRSSAKARWLFAILWLVSTIAVAVDIASVLCHRSLHALAYYGQTREIRARISRGDDPNVRSYDGRTPIIVAAQSKQYDALVLLADSGGDVNAVDDLGSTALCYAVFGRDCETVGLLLARGADPNLPGKAGRLPLVEALVLRAPEIVRALLAAGASLDEADCYGVTPKEVVGKLGLDLLVVPPEKSVVPSEKSVQP